MVKVEDSRIGDEGNTSVVKVGDSRRWGDICVVKVGGSRMGDGGNACVVKVGDSIM